MGTMCKAGCNPPILQKPVHNPNPQLSIDNMNPPMQILMSIRVCMYTYLGMPAPPMGGALRISRGIWWHLGQLWGKVGVINWDSSDLDVFRVKCGLQESVTFFTFFWNLVFPCSSMSSDSLSSLRHPMLSASVQFCWVDDDSSREKPMGILFCMQTSSIIILIFVKLAIKSQKKTVRLGGFWPYRNMVGPRKKDELEFRCQPLPRWSSSGRLRNAHHGKTIARWRRLWWRTDWLVLGWSHPWPCKLHLPRCIPKCRIQNLAPAGKEENISMRNEAKKHQ